jgi:hypothetical protein
MSDTREPTERRDAAAYEPPEVEALGSADELAKGNEGSHVDDHHDPHHQVHRH